MVNMLLKIKSYILLINKILFVSLTLYYILNYKAFKVSLNLFPKIIKEWLFIQNLNVIIESFGLVILIIPLTVVLAALLLENKSKILNTIATLIAIGGNIFTLGLSISRGTFNEYYKFGFLSVYSPESLERKKLIFKTVLENQIKDMGPEKLEFIQRNLNKNYLIEYDIKLRGLAIDQIESYAKQVGKNLEVAFHESFAVKTPVDFIVYLKFITIFAISLGVITGIYFLYKYFVNDNITKEDLIKGNMLGKESAENTRNLADIASNETKINRDSLEVLKKQLEISKNDTERIDIVSNLLGSTIETVNKNASLLQGVLIKNPTLDNRLNAISDRIHEHQEELRMIRVTVDKCNKEMIAGSKKYVDDTTDILFAEISKINKTAISLKENFTKLDDIIKNNSIIAVQEASPSIDSLLNMITNDLREQIKKNADTTQELQDGFISETKTIIAMGERLDYVQAKEKKVEDSLTGVNESLQQLDNRVVSLEFAAVRTQNIFENTNYRNAISTRDVGVQADIPNNEVTENLDRMQKDIKQLFNFWERISTAGEESIKEQEKLRNEVIRLRGNMDQINKDNALEAWRKSKNR